MTMIVCIPSDVEVVEKSKVTAFNIGGHQITCMSGHVKTVLLYGW